MLIISGILDCLRCIPDSKAQDLKFRKQNFLFQIPESRFPHMGKIHRSQASFLKLSYFVASKKTTDSLPITEALCTTPAGTSIISPGWRMTSLPFIANRNWPAIIESFLETLWVWSGKSVPGGKVYFMLPREQRLHFRGMSWCAKSSYFSHARSYRENVASARRVILCGSSLLTFSSCWLHLEVHLFRCSIFQLVILTSCWKAQTEMTAST